MVRTPRHQPPPAQLTRHQARWTGRWEDIRAGRREGDWATAGAKKALKPALEPLARGKCVFCESLLGVTAPLEIEHYVAKALRPDLVFEWTNLFPACRECNGAKRDADHQGALLKPDEDDPEPYFWVNPSSGELEPHPRLDEAGRQRALQTIEICNLQRGPLCVKRFDAWQRTGEWLNRTPGSDADAERERLLSPSTEYKLVIRHVLDLRGQSDLAAEDRRRFEAPPQTTSSLTGSQRTLRSRQ